MYLLTPNGDGYGNGYGSGSGNGAGNVGSKERFSFEHHIIMGAVRAHNLGEHDHEANS